MEWTVPNLVFPITTAWVWMVAQMANIKCKPFESFMLRSSSSPSSGVGYNRDSMSSMVFHPGPSHSCSNPSDNESVTTIRRVAKVNIRRETTGSLMSLSGTISSLRKSQRFNEKKLYGAHLTPDLIRASKCGSTLENDVQWLECPGEPSRLDETIYSEIKGSSCYSSTNAIKSNTLQYSDKLPQPTLHQKKYQFPLTTKCQKQRASSQSPNFNELDDHSVSFSPTTVQTPGSQEKLCEEHLSKSFSNTIQPSNLRTNERLVLTNVDFHPFLSQRTRSSNQLTVLPIIDSSPKMTFPILTSVEFYPQQLETTGSQEEISYGQSSGQVPPESVSTSNTPIMRRSFSSMSRTSNTVLFPSRKGSWVSPEFLSSMVAESTGRFSPSPSEASRTESALAPPPSNASHASHNSEASKTESARGIVPDTRENEEEEEEFEEDATTRSECECSSSSGDEDIRENPENVPPAHTRTSSNPGERGRKDRKNDEDDENRISSLGTIPSQNSHAAPCISMRPLVSSGIHKATIQRVTKSGRGLSKPWYEIEGSDDEGSLLQKTRSSRSSKLSTSSLSNSQSENETSDEEEHHECPDFV